MAQHQPDHLLRRSLQANAAFSAISGLLLVAAAQPIGRLIGFELPALYVALGLGLMGFALALFAIARRPVLRPMEARWASLLDLGWVVGSVGLLVLPDLAITLEGRWLIALVADTVALFALLQWLGLQRLTRAGAGS